MATTFAVSEVETQKSRLAVTTAAARVAELGWKTFEAVRLGAAELVAGPLVHPLVHAVDLAFAGHRPLILTPDAVWSCLAQSLALHVEQHAEKLRSRLVRHAGQLELVERRDDFLPGDPDNDWPGAVAGLTEQIRAHLGGKADLFVGDFSTTGPLERVASQIALMGAMRQYFRYTVMTLCGIPSITLAGTPEDWASIRRRVAVFGEFDLGWWVKELDPVLAKLEATSRGRIDREFWRGMYKLEHESGGDRMYGWLSKLFAYVGDPPARNQFPAIDGVHFTGLGLSDFPAGRTRVPFVWQILETRFDMELVGGLWGVTQDDEGRLGVASGWLVARARTPSGWRRSPGEDGEATSLDPPPNLESLASLEHEAGDEPTAVRMYRPTRLRSLDGIEHLRGLVELTVCEAPLLESIAPLANLHLLERLDLRACPRLANVGAVLATLPQLRDLCLMENPHLPLADFLPIVHMPALERVTLWRCDGVPEHLRCRHEGAAAVAALRAALSA